MVLSIADDIELCLTDYWQAYGQFHAVAERNGYQIQHYTLDDVVGLEGEALRISAAFLPAAEGEAEYVYTTSSGLHGAEGFLGSAVQAVLMDSDVIASRPANVAALHIHAINAEGMAYYNRDYQGIDLNRCGLLWGHSGLVIPEPHPLTAELNNILLPESGYWNTWPPQGFFEFVQKHGPKTMQDVLTSGQYFNPHYLFYGGSEEPQPLKTCKRIAQDFCMRAKGIVRHDYHSGLGPERQVEFLAPYVQDDPRLEMAKRIYGRGRTKSPFVQSDGSESSAVTGDFWSAVDRIFKENGVDTMNIAFEFGITGDIGKAVDSVATANYQTVREPDNAELQAIKKGKIMEAFAHSDPTRMRRVAETCYVAAQKAMASFGPHPG